jgi:hypothetical protein
MNYSICFWIKGKVKFCNRRFPCPFAAEDYAVKLALRVRKHASWVVLGPRGDDLLTGAAYGPLIVFITPKFPYL